MTKVKQISIAEAIESLDPTAGFMYGPGEDISTIVWDDDANPISAENIQAEINRLQSLEPLKALRAERNQRLANTDWWASSDLTMTEAQTAYRQALRDITETYTSLDDVVWPEVPNE